MKLKLVGYWKSKYEPQYPDPIPDEAFWNRIHAEHHGLSREMIASYLDSGIRCNRFMGFSSCRICGEHLGTYERHDNVYVWPDKLSHYVLLHSVRLPLEFVLHINEQFSHSVDRDDDWWIKNHNH